MWEGERVDHGGEQSTRVEHLCDWPGVVSRGHYASSSQDHPDASCWAQLSTHKAVELLLDTTVMWRGCLGAKSLVLCIK